MKNLKLLSSEFRSTRDFAARLSDTVPTMMSYNDLIRYNIFSLDLTPDTTPSRCSKFAHSEGPDTYN